MDDKLTCAVHGEQEEWLCVCKLCQEQLEAARREMTYEEFEDRHGAETTGDREAVWNAAFEECKRQAVENNSKCIDCGFLKQIIAGQKEEIAQLEAELAECHLSRHEIEHLLGHALYGYSKEGLPLWGEHTAESLAEEAARKLSGKNHSD